MKPAFVVHPITFSECTVIFAVSVSISVQTANISFPHRNLVCSTNWLIWGQLSKPAPLQATQEAQTNISREWIRITDSLASPQHLFWVPQYSNGASGFFLLNIGTVNCRQLLCRNSFPTLLYFWIVLLTETFLLLAIVQSEIILCFPKPQHLRILWQEKLMKTSHIPILCIYFWMI